MLCCPMEDPAEAIPKSGSSPGNSRRRHPNGSPVGRGGLQSAPYRHHSMDAADGEDSVQAALRLAEVTRRRALSAMSPPSPVARRRAYSHQLGVGELVVPLAVAAQVAGMPISTSESDALGDFPSRPSSAQSTGELPSSKSPCGSQGSGSPLQTRTSNTPRSESSTGSYEAWRAALRARIAADAELQVRARMSAEDPQLQALAARDEQERPFENLFAAQHQKIEALSP